MELSGIKYTEDEIIQAKICDNLSLLVWSKTKDAEHNRNRPKMMSEIMLGIDEESNNNAFESDVFDSVDEFWKAREKALNKE